MSDPIPNTPPTSDTSRETNGRFAKGNPGGPGNPFARKTAALRQALLDTVTKQDIQDIAAKLRDDAKAGDKAAIKLLFQYVIGKPQPAVDPDTLDVQELRGYMAGAVPPEVMEEMQRGLPVSMLLKLWPFFLFAKEQANVEGVGEQSAACEAKQQRRAERARQETAEGVPSANGDNGHAPAEKVHAAPSRNGFHGHNGFAEAEEAPSLNGDNGDMLDFLAHLLRGRQLPPDGAPQT